MSNFFSPEAEMALMGQDEALGQSFPSTSYHSPALYAPAHVQHASSQPSIHSNAGNPPYLPIPPQYSSVPTSTYPQQAYWTPAAPTAEPSQLSVPTMSSPSLGFTSPPTIKHGLCLPVNRGLVSRASRSPSFTSVGTYPGRSSPVPSRSDHSRSASPSSADLRAYGYLNNQGTWSCAFPGCTSRAIFTRGCDLRKHYKRHTKSFFCLHKGCPQATGGGFSSKKDLARHEAKHNPGVICDWKGCDRIFSRVDNMRDHVKRIHLKNSRTSSSAAT